MELSTILSLIQAEGAAASAGAEGAEATGGGGMMTIFWILIIVMFVWMLFIKPMKDQKKRKEELNKLTEGTKVVTSGGIYGRVREVSETTLVIEVSSGVKLTVDKSCVYPVPENNDKKDKK